MGVWFFENYQFLFDSKSPDCLKIAEQYKKKRLLDKEKARRKYRNYRLMFYKESNINKFAFGSNVSFQDGTLMNEWFDKNKENIFDSKQPIDVYIQSQYREFLMYYDLRREFLEEENLDKFNPEGNVRFLTGAIMYFWWERYKDGILTSNFNSDEEIKNQYNEFNDNNVKLKLGKKKF